MIPIVLQVGLTGTHRVGKTTLVNHVLPDLGPYVSAKTTNLVRGVAQSLGIERCDDMLENRDDMRLFQRSILVEYLDRNMRCTNNHTSAISDRTLLDIRAYLIVYERMLNDTTLDFEEEPLTQEELRIILNAIRYSLSYYDVICYVSKLGEESDGDIDIFRPTDSRIRDAVDVVVRQGVREMESYLHNEQMAYPILTVLNTNNLMERKNQLINVVHDAFIIESALHTSKVKNREKGIQ